MAYDPTKDMTNEKILDYFKRNIQKLDIRILELTECRNAMLMAKGDIESIMSGEKQRLEKCKNEMEKVAK